MKIPGEGLNCGPSLGNTTSCWGNEWLGPAGSILLVHCSIHPGAPVTSHLIHVISSPYWRTASPEFSLVSYWGEVDKRKFRDALCSLSYCSWSQDYANKQTKQSKIQKALPHPNHPFPLVILDSLISSANTSTGQLVYAVKSHSPLLGVVFSQCFLHLSIYCQNWARVLTGIPMDCCIPNVFYSATNLDDQNNLSHQDGDSLPCLLVFWHKKPPRLGRICGLKLNQASCYIPRWKQDV